MRFTRHIRLQALKFNSKYGVAARVRVHEVQRFENLWNTILLFEQSASNVSYNVAVAAKFTNQTQM